MVHLTVQETWQALREAQQLGIIGGGIYDVLIAASVLKAGASTLLTWNPRSFARFGEKINVLAPP